MDIANNYVNIRDLDFFRLRKNRNIKSKKLYKFE